MQSRFLHDGLASADADSTTTAYGESLESALYEAADGWLYVEAPDLEALLSPAAFDTVRPTARGLSETEARAAIAEVIRSRSREEWVAEYASTGVQVAPLRLLSELAHPHVLEGGGRVAVAKHPEQGTVQYLETLVRGAAAEGLTYDRAPIPGEHTASVLAKAGLAQEEIDSLFRQGAVFDRVVAR